MRWPLLLEARRMSKGIHRGLPSFFAVEFMFISMTTAIKDEAASFSKSNVFLLVFTVNNKKLALFMKLRQATTMQLGLKIVLQLLYVSFLTANKVYSYHSSSPKTILWASKDMRLVNKFFFNIDDGKSFGNPHYCHVTLA
jgi:hypothetical protein